ncbi:ATP-binding protein [Flavobacterium sp. IMCC34852]|uniref:ATP-binding protein n=1 Tax=Flavobacterium rivulicola TaxID=2732161 RepID=A0A7Y3RAT2_9FLAO|nr:ATP-binding protein [Flavobacterium sp. IMCC34852]NNT73085.1 ATP-binding protein [Flavobacterium sp. IMCC34852]
MLIDFSVANYLSIKDSITLSMIASNTVKELEGNDDELNNTFYDKNEKNKYLKSAVLYGANGSGKSNLLTAMAFFRRFILTSSNDRSADDEIKALPFLLSTDTEFKPSCFEMVFVIDSIRYRYGFEATQKRIISEWLFALDFENSIKESNLFTREEQEIKVSSKNFKEGKGLEDKTRPNALFLSTASQLNGKISNKIQTWFRTRMNVISGLQDHTTDYTIGKFQDDEKFRKKIIDFFRLTNIGIEDIEIEETALNNLSKIKPKTKEDAKIAALIEQLQEEIKERMKRQGEAKELTINSLHKKFDSANNVIENIALSFDLESKGTQKLFALLGPIFDTLEKGKILIIDELDSKLHTKLTSEILRIFQSNVNNKCAQLIFASHDTNLLRNDLFRRDQIWFTEKDEQGATDLYSLVEYKINQATRVRNDASFEKDYLIGKYGAIPYFGNIQKFLNEFIDG